METLKCTACGGQMQITERVPGDKIAICPYCQTTVDLEDESVKERIQESSEEIVEDGRTIRRTTRTVERHIPGSAEMPGMEMLDPSLQSVLQSVMGGEHAGTPRPGMHVFQQTNIDATKHTKVSGKDAVEILKTMGVNMPQVSPPRPMIPWWLLGLMVIALMALAVLIAVILSLLI